jgi:hypothetical protein
MNLLVLPLAQIYIKITDDCRLANHVSLSGKWVRTRCSGAHVSIAASTDEGMTCLRAKPVGSLPGTAFLPSVPLLRNGPRDPSSIIPNAHGIFFTTREYGRYFVHFWSKNAWSFASISRESLYGATFNRRGSFNPYMMKSEYIKRSTEL